MSHRLAIAGTCFLIDWSSYRRRALLSELFTSIFIPENVLDEVYKEDTIMWISSELATGSLQLYTPPEYIVREAEHLVSTVASRPHLRRIELPEAICLAAGRSLGAVVLTENLGALQATLHIPEYHGVKVWRALEVLREALLKGLIKASSRSEVEEVFREYEHDTRHLFSRESLERVISEVITLES